MMLQGSLVDFVANQRQVLPSLSPLGTLNALTLETNLVKMHNYADKDEGLTHIHPKP